MNETDFLRTVIDLAQRTGWRVAHFRVALTNKGWRTPVQADGKGFPDLVMIHKERELLIVAELKSESGKLSPEQEEWLDHFRVIALLSLEHIKVFVWRPSMWDEIEKIIGGEYVR